jgi:hypothetical protein
MVDLLEGRVRKFARMSAHYRELADGFLSPDVSAQIEEVAEEYAREAARLERECVGKRDCPCELSNGCRSSSLTSFH